jgi:uncharacterized membrane protein
VTNRLVVVQVQLKPGPLRDREAKTTLHWSLEKQIINPQFLFKSLHNTLYMDETLEQPCLPQTEANQFYSEETSTWETATPEPYVNMDPYKYKVIAILATLCLITIPNFILIYFQDVSLEGLHPVSKLITIALIGLWSALFAVIFAAVAIAALYLDNRSKNPYKL